MKTNCLKTIQTFKIKRRNAIADLCICVHMYMCVCMCVCVCAYMYACMWICAHACVHVCLFVFVSVSVSAGGGVCDCENKLGSLENKWHVWRQLTQAERHLPVPYRHSLPSGGSCKHEWRSHPSLQCGSSCLKIKYTLQNIAFSGILATSSSTASIIYSVSIPPSCYHRDLLRATHKRSWSFCQKCRWKVAAKHAYTLHMWLCMKQHGAWLYGVHKMHWDHSSFMWHQPYQRCKVHHFGGYSKMRYKELVIHVESHACAVSLLKSREQHYIKAIIIIWQQYKVYSWVGVYWQNLLTTGHTSRPSGY